MCGTIYGIFCLYSIAVARYAALIQAKSPANCAAHLAESIFQTRSRSFFVTCVFNFAVKYAAIGLSEDLT